MTATAEIIVKDCSHVLLELLTTSNPDSYVTMAAVHKILSKSVRLCRLDRNDWRAGFWPTGRILDTTGIYHLLNSNEYL